MMRVVGRNFLQNVNGYLGVSVRLGILIDRLTEVENFPYPLKSYKYSLNFNLRILMLIVTFREKQRSSRCKEILFNIVYYYSFLTYVLYNILFTIFI